METTSQQVCDEVMVFLGRVKTRIFAMADEQGLTRTQLIALYFVDLNGGLAMGQMAEVLHCDASNVTGIVDRLVGRNLIERKEAEHDRRTKKLQLTDKGKQVVATVKAALPKLLGCDRMDAHEREALHNIMQKVSQ